MNETPSFDVRVKSIHVKQLFGMYNHDIPLNPEHMTILFGRNGVGKTVMFKLTHAILSGETAPMLDLLRYPFREFKIVLSDNSLIVVTRKEGKGGIREAHLKLTSSSIDDVEFSINEKVFHKSATRLERHSPFHQIGTHRWMDDETGEEMSALDVVAKWGYLNDDELPSELILWKKTASTHFPKTLFIQAQRLIQVKRTTRTRPFIDLERSSIRDTVLEYSAELKQRIDQTLAEYGREAQRLDQSYPQRLLQEANRQSGAGLMTQTNILDALATMRTQQVEYQTLGILEEQAPPDMVNQGELTDVYRAAMSVYVRDTQAKLGILDNLAQRVRLMLDLIREKFSNKTLKIDPKTHDLVVESTQGSFVRLSVNTLSSGEQHQLILAYDLLFRTQPNTLVLLDEPELSLHVDWQERFLNDLRAIIQLIGFDAILATHSPYIINGYNELTVGLSVQVRPAMDKG